MTIPISANFEARIREKAEAEGLTVEPYGERLAGAEQDAEEELSSLAFAGLNSGATVAVGPEYREEKHRRLDEMRKRTESH